MMHGSCSGGQNGIPGAVRWYLAALLLPCLMASGCATHAPAPVLYDFGPGSLTLASGINPSATPRLPALNVAEVRTPAWLDGPLMFYRLAYANVQQPYPYAGSRWSMTPAQLLEQRIKARIAQEGGTVLSRIDGASGLPVLRLEADDFSQIFATPSQSTGQITLRASLFDGSKLLAQRQFSHQVDAPTADAPGGARALATAADFVISDILNWLAGLPQVGLPQVGLPQVGLPQVGLPQKK